MSKMPAPIKLIRDSWLIVMLEVVILAVLLWILLILACYAYINYEELEIASRSVVATVYIEGSIYKEGWE